jgi:hypothetical protein
MGASHTVRERGQLILVGALSLAIVLVGLALVLNSAIYAENFATRANQGEAGRITQLEQEAVQGAGASMQHHHHDADSHASYTNLVNNFEASVDEWADMVVQDSARRGQYVDATTTGTYTNGTRIAQDDGSTFEPKESDAILEVDLLSSLTGSLTTEYWAVTPDASQVRDFSMTVDHDRLGDDGASLLELEASVAGQFLADLELDADGELGLVNALSLSDAPFTVVYDVNDDNDIDHSIAIYPANEDDVNVTYHRHDGSGVTRTCTVEDADSTFTIDVSNGWVEGGDGACSEVFAFQSEISDPYQLLFVSGDQIAGDYELIVDDPNQEFEDDYDDLDLLDLSLFGLFGGTPDFGDYYDDHTDGHGSSYSPSSPYVEPALYSAEIRVRYQTDATSYNGTRTVAPNEP